MELNNWLSEQMDSATIVFHVGKDLKVSEYTQEGALSFHLVLDGECWLQLEGTKHYVHLVKNDVVFFSRNQNITLLSSEYDNIDSLPGRARHRLNEEKYDSTSMLCGLMHPTNDAIKLLFALMPRILLVKSNIQLRLILELLNVEYHARKPLGYISVSRLTDLLLLYVIERALREKDIDLNIVRAAKDPKLASLFLCIMNTPEDDWTLQKMAENTGLSRSTFIRRLSCACNGYTSNEILSRLRMSLAAAMMTDGVKAADAGRKVGYNSVSGFNKAIRKIRNTS